MKHHPQKEIIHKYSTGELNVPLAFMVSAHLELCGECQLDYQNCLEKEATQLTQLMDETFQMSNHEMNEAFDLTWHKIESQKNRPISHESKIKKVSVNVSGKSITLPSSMNFLEGQEIPWKDFGKKNSIAPISVGENGNFYLIYIGPGEKVPAHNHSGNEYSYVAAGS